MAQSANNFEKIKSGKIPTKGVKVEKDKGFKIDRKQARKGKGFGRGDK